QQPLWHGHACRGGLGGEGHLPEGVCVRHGIDPGRRDESARGLAAHVGDDREDSRGLRAPVRRGALLSLQGPLGRRPGQVQLYRVALREALAEEMQRDENVFLIGEDIGKFGGAYRVTDGLLDKFGADRVVDAPIAEEVIVGTAIGSAMLGLRPVVEMMTINFSLIAFDQIVNNAAKIRYMFGGEAKVPMVIRMPGGAGHQLSAQHSHSFEVLYGLIPGLLVVAPTTPEDAKGMLKSAIRTDNPVMFLESMSLYNVKGDVPPGDYTTPLGKAPLRRNGSDVTIVGVSRMAVLANEAAKQLEEEDIDAEVIDLRSIRPIDWEPI